MIMLLNLKNESSNKNLVLLMEVEKYLISNYFIYSFTLAFKINEESSYEEAIYAANQLRKTIEIPMDQALFSLYKSVG